MREVTHPSLLQSLNSNRQKIWKWCAILIVFILLEQQLVQGCQDAQQISKFPAQIRANISSEELLIECNGYSSTSYGTWFKLAKFKTNTRVSLSICDTCFDTTLSLFSSTSINACGTNGNPPKCITFNDDNNQCNQGSQTDCYSYNSLWSSLTFCASAGEEYSIYVSSYGGGSSGEFTLNIEEVGSCNKPSNDECSSALSITSFPTELDIDIVDSLGGSFECNKAAEGTKSVWFTIMGDGNFLSISRFSEYSSSLIVFTGDDCLNLECYGGNFQSDNNQHSLEWCGFEGEKYWILLSSFVSSKSISEITYILNFTKSDPCEVVSNQKCIDSIAIEEVPTYINGSTRGLISAQLDLPTNCAPGSISGMVWYSFKGTGTFLSLHLCNETSFDTFIYLYSGSCNSLKCEAQNDNYCGKQSYISFCSILDRHYYVLIGGNTGETGNFQLTIDQGKECVADVTICEGALELAVPSIVFGDTRFLAATSPPPNQCNTYLNRVNIQWYKFKGTGHMIDIDTEGSCYDTALILYISYGSNTCKNLQCIHKNDDYWSFGSSDPSIYYDNNYSGSNNTDYENYDFWYWENYTPQNIDSCLTAYKFTYFTSEIEFCSAKDQDYYLLVTGYYRNNGLFTLSISSNEDTLCIPNTRVTAPLVVTLGESVSFANIVFSESNTPTYFCGERQRSRGLWYSISSAPSGLLEFSYCHMADYSFTVLVFSNFNASHVPTGIYLDTCIAGFTGEEYSCYEPNHSFSWASDPSTIYWIFITTDERLSFTENTAFSLPLSIFTIQRRPNNVAAHHTSNDECSSAKYISYSIYDDFPIKVTSYLQMNRGDNYIFRDFNTGVLIEPPQYSWYYVHGIGHNLVISTCNSEASVKIAVLEEKCNFGRIVTSNTKGCQSEISDYYNNNAYVEFCAISRMNYYILVAPDQYLSTNASFTIELTLLGSCELSPCYPGVSAILDLYDIYPSNYNGYYYYDQYYYNGEHPEYPQLYYNVDDGLALFETKYMVPLVDIHSINLPLGCVNGLDNVYESFWFSFTPDINSYFVISVCGNNTEMLFAIYENCDNLQCIGGGSNQCTAPPPHARTYDPFSNNELTSHCYQQSETYYIMVGNRYAIHDEFYLLIQSIGECISSPPIINQCTSEIEGSSSNEITSLPFFIVLPQSSPTSNLLIPSCSEYNYGNWFTILGDSKTITIDGCFRANSPLNIQLYEDCNQPLLPCSTSFSSASSVCKLQFCGFPDTRYYILLYSHNPNSDLIYIDEAEECTGEPSKPLVYSTLVTTSEMTFTWIPPFSYDFPILQYNYKFEEYVWWSSDIIIAEGSTTNTTLTFSNLKKGQEYYFSLIAVNRWGESYQTTLYITTNAGECFLPTPNFLTLPTQRFVGEIAGNIIYPTKSLTIESVDIILSTNSREYAILVLYESSNSQYLQKYFVGIESYYEYAYPYLNDYDNYPSNPYPDYQYNFYFNAENYADPNTVDGEYYYGSYYYNYYDDTTNENDNSSSDDSYYDWFYSYFYNYFYYYYNFEDDTPEVYPRYSPVELSYSDLNWEICAGKSYFLGIYFRDDDYKLYQYPESTYSDCFGRYEGAVFPDFIFPNEDYEDGQFWLSDDVRTAPFFMRIDAIENNVTVPSTPEFTNVDTSISSITVNWEVDCQQGIDYFILQLNNEKPLNLSYPKSTYIFNNLPEDTSFTISLKAINEYGESEVNEITLQTLSLEYGVAWTTPLNLRDSEDSQMEVHEITVDHYNNSIMVGYFREYVEFSATQRFSTPKFSAEGFIVSYNIDGDVNWARKVGNIADSTSVLVCETVATDNVGSIFVGGYFYGNVYFSENEEDHYSNYYYSAFLVKYDSGGNFINSQVIDRSEDSTVYTDCSISSIVIDNDNDVVAVGSLYGFEIDFAGTEIDLDYFSFFIARFSNRDFELLAVKIMPLLQTNSTYLGSVYVTIDREDNNLYMAGPYINYLEYNDFEYLPGPFEGVYIMRLDYDFEVVWIRSITAIKDTVLVDLKATTNPLFENEGPIYLTVWSTGDTYIFDSDYSIIEEIHSFWGNSGSSLVISLDKYANLNWASTVVTDWSYGNNSPTVRILSTETLPNYDIIIVGGYVQTFDTRDSTVTSLPVSSYTTGFIAQVSAEGTLLWSDGFTTENGFSYISEVAIHSRSRSIGDEVIQVAGVILSDGVEIDCTHSFSSSNLNSFTISYQSVDVDPDYSSRRTSRYLTFSDFSGSYSYPDQNFGFANYENNVDLNLLFKPDDDVYHIEVTITYFDLADENDYLVAFDGNSTTYDVLKYYNGKNAKVTTSTVMIYDNYENENELVIRSKGNALWIYFHSDRCHTGRGFTLSYKSTPKLAHCDNDFPQYYKLSSGLISENPIGGYQNNANCVFYVQPQFSVQYIVVDFVRFSLANDDYIAIYDGDYIHPDTLLATFYGSDRPYTIQSSKREIIIQFVSNEKNYRDGWVIQYTGMRDKSFCSGIQSLNDEAGAFLTQSKSRQYYSPSQNCIWHLNDKVDNYLTSLTYLYFPSLQLNEHSYVEVKYKEGEDQLIQNITQPNQLIISDTSVNVHFNANNGMGKGLEGRYCIQSELLRCGGQNYTEKQGFINNTFCGPYYQANAFCSWMIMPNFTNDIQYIMLTFSLVDFANEIASKGITDSLTIQECYPSTINTTTTSSSSSSSSSSICRGIGKLWKSKSDYNTLNQLPVIVTDKPQLKLLFESDTYLAGEGFRSLYCTKLKSDISEVVLTSPTGTFNNFFCNGYYPANSTLTWKVQFPKQSGIVIFIITGLHFVNEEWNGSQWNDNLYIYQSSADIDSGLLYTFNNGGMFQGYTRAPAQQFEGGMNISNPLILSFSEEVALKFISDDKGFGRGFNASYCIYGENDGRLCSNTTYTSRNIIIGNQACGGYYQPNANCSFYISPVNFTTSKEEIILFFLSLNFNNNKTSDIITDYIEVYDGSRNETKQLGKYFNESYSTLPVLLATTSPVIIDFQSDDVLFGKGFEIEYCVVTSPATTCGGQVKQYIESSGSFSDHVCGPTFIAPLDCRWRIAPQSYNYTYLVVVFTELDVGFTEGAVVNIFTPNDTYPTISSYPVYPKYNEKFGESIAKGLAMFFTTPQIDITFKVQASVPLRSGWTVEYYTVVDNGICKGLNIYNETQNGTISDHTYGDYYQNNLQCTFLITLPSSTSNISVIFNEFDLENGYDFLEVYDGDYWTSEMIGLYTGNTLPTPFTSSSNSLYFVFTTDYSAIKKGFSFYYTDSLLLECQLYCSNHGKCNQGVCECEEGRYGRWCEIGPPPFLLDAKYTPTLGEITVTFSENTNRANMILTEASNLTSNNISDCSFVLSPSTISKLGKNPSCHWYDDQILIIKLGYRSTFIPNIDMITIKPNVLSAAHPTPDTPFSQEMSTLLLLPDIVSPPIPIIVGPSTYRPGSPLDLNAFASFVDGGRELSYSWILLECQNCAVFNPAHPTNCSCLPPPDNTPISQLLATSHNSTLSITPQYLSDFYFLNQGFLRFIVNVTNFINITGSSVPFNLFLAQRDAPSVSILGPSFRSVRRGEVLLIKSKVQIPNTNENDLPPTPSSSTTTVTSRSVLDCPNLLFRWEFESCSPSPCPFSLATTQITSNTSQLYLDTNQLEFDGEYIVRVTVVLDNDPNLKAQARVKIGIQPIKVVLQIQGGNQVMISKDKDIELTSEVILPPPQFLSNCHYRWSCMKYTGQPCLIAKDKYLELDDSPSITLSVKKLLPGSYIFTSLMKCDDGISGMDQTTINILRRNQTLIKIISNFDVTNFNPTDPLVLEVISAEENRPLLENIQWSVLSGNFLLTSATLLSESSQNESLAIAPNVLQGGTKLSLQVTANVLGLEPGSAKIEITINDPPSPGILSVSPLLGSSIDTSFTFTSDGTSDWEFDLPLRYIFGIIPQSCDDVLAVYRLEYVNATSQQLVRSCTEIPISNIVEFPVFSAFLPPGTLLPFVDVIDRSNVRTRVIADSIIIVNDDCPPTLNDLTLILSDMLNRMNMLACMGQADQVRQIFNMANHFMSCPRYRVDNTVIEIFHQMQTILLEVVSTSQITSIYLDSQIKTMLLSSNVIKSRSEVTNDDKLSILSSAFYAAKNATSVGFQRSDTPIALLNSLSNIGTIPSSSISSFNQIIQSIGHANLKQYACNNIANSVFNPSIQLSSRKLSPSKLSNEPISSLPTQSSSSSSVFQLPANFAAQSGISDEDCVMYTTSDLSFNPFESANTRPTFSHIVDLTFKTVEELPLKISNLTSPIVISLPITYDSTYFGDAVNITGGYWNPLTKKWDWEGCKYIGSSNDYYYLQVDHLTSFAILLGDVNSDKNSSPEITISIPEFDPAFTEATEIFGTSNLDKNGNLQNDFTQFSLIPPSAFLYPLDYFLSKVDSKLEDYYNNNHSGFSWNSVNILSVAFGGAAILIFIIAIILYSVPAVRSALNGSNTRRTRFAQKASSRKAQMHAEMKSTISSSATPAPSDRQSATLDAEDEEYWDT